MIKIVLGKLVEDLFGGWGGILLVERRSFRAGR